MTKVLIIEDEEHIRENIALALTYQGFTTLEAANGIVGVEVAQQDIPDLIICDIMMPELDGYEVLRQLQLDPATATIPFIFSTALADRQSVRYGMQLGADDYLTKPFTNEELLASIRTRLNKHQTASDTYQKLDNANITQQIPLDQRVQNTHSLVGATLRGYQILETIGEGGAGTVYKAYQPALGREVAVKVLRQKYADSLEFTSRFQTEAELVARLEHPHIIPLYDYWHDESGLYIVMRWLRGGSLRDVLEHDGKLTLARTTRLLDQVTDALSIAHEVGIIHRDLKPDNILLDEYGNAYLTDFGLAKNLTSGTTAPLSQQDLNTLLEAQDDFFRQEPTNTLYLSDTEKLNGTPAYLSPEQIRFEPLSAQTDIYSLAITLYEMLAGEQPFLGSISEIVVQHIEQKLPRLHKKFPEIPSKVDEVLQKASAKYWRKRYPDVRALASDFRQACQQTV